MHSIGYIHLLRRSSARIWAMDLVSQLSALHLRIAGLLRGVALIAAHSICPPDCARCLSSKNACNSRRDVEVAAEGRMRFRKLRIAWSVVWGLAAVLLIVLWVRSYWWVDQITRHCILAQRFGAGSIAW